MDVYAKASARVDLVVKYEGCSSMEEMAMACSVDVWKISAPHVTEVKGEAFWLCIKLTEAILPNVLSVDVCAFADCRTLASVSFSEATFWPVEFSNKCYAFHNVIFSPNVACDDETFLYCLSLEVLAASTGFEIDTENKVGSGGVKHLDPTVGITQYPHWRSEMDESKEQFKHWHLMLKVGKWHVDKETGIVGCEPVDPVDPVSKFMFKHKDTGVTSHILPFLGEKRGYGDLRGATHKCLLEVGLELGVLRANNNYPGNQEFWGVRVNNKGEVASP